MKKYLMAGVLASLLLCCTGCGKKLTCSGKMIGMDAKVITNFSGDKAKSVNMEFTVDLKDLGYDEDADVKEAAKEVEKTFKDMDGYNNVKVTTKGSTITVKCDYEIDADDAEATSYDDTKESFEKAGLTCK